MRTAHKCAQKIPASFRRDRNFLLQAVRGAPDIFQGTEHGGPDWPGGRFYQTVSLAMAIMSAMVSGSAAIAA